MSVSKKRAKKRSILTEVYCNQTRSIPFVTADGVEFHIMDAIICPLCMNIINVEDEDKITLEDVPPESVGGEPLLITCQTCNNTLGNTESHLHNVLQVFYLLRHPDNHRYKSEFILNGVKIKGYINTDLIGEKPYIHCTIDANDVRNYPLFNSELDNNWDGGQLEIKSNLTSVKRNDKYTNIAILKSAYLMAFSKLGYMYILSNNLDSVREQIQEPDADILQNSFLIGRGLKMLPDIKDGVYYAKVDGTDCVLVIISFKHNNDDEICLRAAVALPHPNDNGNSLFSYLHNANKIKTITCLEDVTELPIRPIRVNELIKDIIIFESTQKELSP